MHGSDGVRNVICVDRLARAVRLCWDTATGPMDESGHATTVHTSKRSGSRHTTQQQRARKSPRNGIAQQGAPQAAKMLRKTHLARKVRLGLAHNRARSRGCIAQHHNMSRPATEHRESCLPS